MRDFYWSHTSHNSSYIRMVYERKQEERKTRERKVEKNKVRWYFDYLIEDKWKEGNNIIFLCFSE